MLTITVTACNQKEGLRDLEEFEKFLSGEYEILSRCRYRKLCSVCSCSDGSNAFTDYAYQTAANDIVTDEYVVQ